MNKIIRISVLLIIAFLFISILIWFAGASSQVTAAPSLSTTEGAIHVTTLEDELNTDGDCSLREAITAANDNIPVDACPTGDAVITDTITFDMAGIIPVTSQLPVTAGGPLVIDGGNVNTTSGGKTSRVFWVEAGSLLTLQRLRIVDRRGYTYGNGAV
jgi:CSLREA domain-containing protein